MQSDRIKVSARIIESSFFMVNTFSYQKTQGMTGDKKHSFT